MQEIPAEENVVHYEIYADDSGGCDSFIFCEFEVLVDHNSNFIESARPGLWCTIFLIVLGSTFSPRILFVQMIKFHDATDELGFTSLGSLEQLSLHTMSALFVVQLIW